MNLQEMLPYLFGAAFTLVIAYLIYKMAKYGGFLGAMFGAPIKSTIGEVTTSGANIIRSVVKVHSLGGDSRDKAVGLEFVAKTMGNYRMVPISLSKADALKLASLLESAAR